MSQRAPLLSVVTIVLNDKDGLIRTLKSIEAQEDVDFELIVVDGGSIDGSELIARETSSVPIDSRPDGGIYQGMQRGADAASGKYLLFCNSGDELYGRNFVSKALQILEGDAQNQNWGFGPIIEFTSRKNYSWITTDKSCDIKSISNRRAFVPFPSFIVSRQLFAAVGGFSFDYKIAGDFDLIVRCSQITQPLRWNVPIALFYSGGISYTRADLAWKEEHLVRVRVLDMSHLSKCKSYLSVNIRILKWWIGKSFDVLQNIGFLGQRHWRDRRSSVVPEQFSAYLPK